MGCQVIISCVYTPVMFKPGLTYFYEEILLILLKHIVYNYHVQPYQTVLHLLFSVHWSTLPDPSHTHVSYPLITSRLFFLCDQYYKNPHMNNMFLCLAYFTLHNYGNLLLTIELLAPGGFHQGVTSDGISFFT